jgi:hypothetical protein
MKRYLDELVLKDEPLAKLPARSNPNLYEPTLTADF